MLRRLNPLLRRVWPLLALLCCLHEQPSRGLDLLVYGGTPQGIAAARSAALHGLSVLLVEPGPQLGGVLTRGWLATLDSSVDGRGVPLYGGTFLRLLRGLGWDPSFDVNTAQRLLDGLAHTGGVQVWTDTQVAGLLEEGGTLRRLELHRAGQRFTVMPRAVIDASDSADLAARAGALFTAGRSDTGLDRRQMAATLVFRLSGVPWSGIVARIQGEQRGQHSFSDVHGRSANGLWELARGYQPSDPTRFKLRGLNLARQDDGSLLVNALLIAGVDGTDPGSVARAHQDGTREAARVVAYLRQADPATFGTATLAGVAPELYLRETRHLVGLSRLHAGTVFYGGGAPDAVAVGGYPLDGQLYDAHESTYLLGRPLPYQVGFSTLVPAGFDNLLVVSQAASFDSTAAFSARVVPLQMVLGDAAGTAAWVAGARGLTFPQLAREPRVLSAALPALPTPSPRLLKAAAYSSEELALDLLGRGLLNLPYYAVGDLDLGGPVTPDEVWADLGHWVYAGHSDAGRVAVLRELGPLVNRARGRPMRGEELREWLLALRLPAGGIPDGVMQRATLVRALSRLSLGPP